MLFCRLYFEDDVFFDLFGVYLVEDLVDVVQFVWMDGCFDQVFVGKVEGFLKVCVGVDDGVGDVQVFEYYVEDWCWEVIWWQVDQGDGVVVVCYVDGLVEGVIGYCGDQYFVGVVDVVLEYFYWVFLLGVDCQVGIEFVCQFQFGVVDVDGGDVQVYGFGVLYGDVVEVIDVGDCYLLVGVCVGLFEFFVDGDVGVEDWCDFSEFDVFWQNFDVVWVG